MKPNKLIFFLVAILFLALLASCSSSADTAEGITIEQLDDLPYNLTVNQVYDAMQTGEIMLIDVRELWEYEEGHIPDATLIPMMEVENRLFEIPKDQHVIVACRSGNRSQQIADFLVSKGYTKVHNMDGGFLDWKAAGLPEEK